MQLQFIRSSPKEYRLLCTRPDQSVTAADLEMRGYLKHDLMHYVIEKNARLKNSFYGPIARGRNLDALTPGAMKEDGSEMEQEAATTEIIVGSMQNATPEEDFSSYVIRLTEYITLQNLSVPEYLTPEFLRNAAIEHQGLMRRFESLRVGGVLTLSFEE